MNEMYKAILKTADKTEKQIKGMFNGDISEQEIKDWIRVYNIIDGIEVVVMKSFVSEKGFIPISWEDDKKMTEYFYQVEQDPMIGTYVDAREEFMEDWNNQEYEPSVTLVFQDEDIEIIEKIKGDSNV